MLDVTFGLVLCAANVVVTALNVSVWRDTGDSRDLAATVAWAGSSAYWLVRSLVAMVG
jgi:hypothetical protein